MNLNKTGRMLIASLLPDTCPVCDEIVKGEAIHRECLDRLEFIRGPVCAKCGKELVLPGRKYCYDCSKYERSFVYGRAMLNYVEPAKSIMAGIKYKNRRDHIEVLGKMLGHFMKNRLPMDEIDAIVPVPVYREKYITRGYNQAELIAKAFNEEYRLPVLTDVIARIRNTKPMKDLEGPRERYENLESAFGIGKILPEDVRKVLLTDDIYTTGATMEACTKVLLSAGAEEVYFACICIGKEF